MPRRSCVLARADRCAGQVLAPNEPAFRRHPFLLGAWWCEECARSYRSAAWAADAEGVGSLCCICGQDRGFALVCDGPCGGYFVTCMSCAVNVCGHSRAAVTAAATVLEERFFCVFCAPARQAPRAGAEEPVTDATAGEAAAAGPRERRAEGGGRTSLLTSYAYKWLRRAKAFPRDVRARAREMARHSRRGGI